MFWLVVIEALLIIVLMVAFAPVGYLGIEVEPSGSTLFLDGHYIGHSPMYLAFITPRHYHLEVGKVAIDGGTTYKGKTANLYIGRFKKTMTNFKLDPLYSYVIRSHPPGATVTIDSKVINDETPCRTNNLEEGKHEMILDLDGYPSIRYIIDTEKTPENILLDFDSNYRLYCDSKPRGARISIDGEIIGRTPCLTEGFSLEKHLFTLELHGYETIEKDVDLSAIGNKINFTLKREKHLGETP